MQKMKSEEKHSRAPVTGMRGDELPLDLETAPGEPPRPVGYRAYVGGVLYVEGFVVLLMGIVLLLSYWPPVSAFGKPANPASKLGLWMAVGSLVYMVIIGIGIFLYNLWRPGAAAARSVRIVTKEPGVVMRAQRYAAMKKRTRYIFDYTIRCEQDADDALRARDLY